MTFAPAAPLLFAGPPGWVAYALLGVGSLAVLGAGAVYMANQKADDQTSDKPQDQVCSTCQPPKDPCKGLRSQLETHVKKLADYLANPSAHDNLGILGKGRDAQIIAGRQRHLQQEIDEFQKQLGECEKNNAK